MPSPTFRRPTCDPEHQPRELEGLSASRGRRGARNDVPRRSQRRWEDITPRSRSLGTISWQWPTRVPARRKPRLGNQSCSANWLRGQRRTSIDPLKPDESLTARFRARDRICRCCWNRAEFPAGFEGSEPSWRIRRDPANQKRHSFPSRRRPLSRDVPAGNRGRRLRLL